MRAHYPRFIRKTPKFFGLTLIDLGIIGFSLSISLAMMMPIVGLALSLLGIALNKIVGERLDFTGLLLSLKRRKRLCWYGQAVGGTK